MNRRTRVDAPAEEEMLMPRKPTAPRTDQEDWLARLRESSHDVFLAGLASLARTRGTGGGGKGVWADFDALVAEGRALEPELRDTVQKTWVVWRERSRSTIGAMPFRTDGRLQGVFQERVEAALRSLGVPTRAEFDALNAKLDRLLGAPTAGGRRRTPKNATQDDTRAARPREASTHGGAPAKTSPRKTTARKTSVR
jgi:poly(hydroxyalkanoate) granule-associated protein